MLQLNKYICLGGCMVEQKPMRGPFKGWRRLALWKQIFIALIAGLVVGVALNMAGMPEVATAIKPIGDLFIRGIKMLIVDRKSTRLNSSHVAISYAVFCLKKKKK